MTDPTNFLLKINKSSVFKKQPTYSKEKMKKINPNEALRKIGRSPAEIHRFLTTEDGEFPSYFVPMLRDCNKD